MKTFLTKEKISTLFLIFFSLSSILDLHIFYNSYATLVRIIFLIIFFLISFICFSKKKDRMVLFSYFIISILYIISHLVFTNDSIVKELLYFIKMFSSVFTFYSVYSLQINYNKVLKYIKGILWFICGSILFCNIFKLGYSSYSFEGIKYNIFEWFLYDNLYFEDVSSKGYFHLANQIVGVVLLYLPLLINDLKEKFKKRDILLLLLVCLSMLAVGNRASSIGPLLILIVSFIVYSFLSLIKREKFNIKFVLVLIGNLVILNIFLYNAPIVYRESYYDDLSSSVNVSYGDESFSDASVRDVLISKNLNNNFIDYYYPYEKDIEFWNELVNKDISFEDSRLIEELIAKRVKELNNNKYSDYFGVGYNRIISICNVERDYVMQYYSIGIIGIILFLGLYFFFYIVSLFKIFINLESKFNFLNIMFALAIGLELLLCYFSGNMLNAISCIMPLSFVVAVFYNETRLKKPNKVLGFNVCKLNKNGIIKEINRNKECNILFNINPLIMCNFYKDYNYKSFMNNQKYNIADGYGTILGLRFKDNSDFSQITGVDMFYELINNACANNKKIYLYGASKVVIKETVKKLKKKYKKIKICGYMDGYSDYKKVLEDIKKTNPDYLFVGMGSPKQEKFIIDNYDDLKNISVIMPVGGTFDVVSGLKRRAPMIYQKLHLEWLYRMVKEPKRVRDNFKIVKYIFLVLFKNCCYNCDRRLENENN